MPANACNRYIDTCSLLNTEIMDHASRIRVSTNNSKIKANSEAQVNQYTSAIRTCDTVINLLVPMKQDVERYINTKRVESMQSINNALRLAEEIVPDASVGAHFELDGEKAYLLTEKGLTVEGTEGDGFLQVSSTLLRAIIAKYSIGMLDTLILDEAFSQLSVENSTTLSAYLGIMAQDTQIISIEQKPQVYSNVDYVQYTFDKTDNFTEVTRHEVKRGDISGSPSP